MPQHMHVDEQIQLVGLFQVKPLIRLSSRHLYQPSLTSPRVPVLVCSGVRKWDYKQKR